MGSDVVGVIKYLADAHDATDERGGVIIHTTSAGAGEEVLSGYYSAQAKQHLLRETMKERDDEEIETMRDFILTKLCYSVQCAVATLRYIDCGECVS